MSRPATERDRARRAITAGETPALLLLRNDDPFPFEPDLESRLIAARDHDVLQGLVIDDRRDQVSGPGHERVR